MLLCFLPPSREGFLRTCARQNVRLFLSLLIHSLTLELSLSALEWLFDQRQPRRRRGAGVFCLSL